MRPRTKTTKPSRLSVAVSKLRQQLGQTQQQFAQTLKTSITTIARYETSRNPSGQILLELEKLAREHGFAEVHDVFYSAVVDEFGIYRHGLATDLSSAASSLQVGLLDLWDSVTSVETKKKIEALFERVLDVERFARILDPMEFRLPEPDPRAVKRAMERLDRGPEEEP